MLTLLKDKAVNIVILLNDLTQWNKSNLFNEKASPKLISSVIPDNRYIGYLSAYQLVRKHKPPLDRVSKAIILSSDKQTPASTGRELGARQYFNTNPSIQVAQVVYAHWEEEKAFKKVHSLLKRHKSIRYIWAANDHMAFGAIKAAKEMGLRPGNDIFISAISTSERVLLARASGDVSLLGGGHFMAGGWALMLIHDHYKGFTVPTQVNERMFAIIEPNSPIFESLRRKNWSALDFTQYSQQHTSKPQYLFQFQP